MKIYQETRDKLAEKLVSYFNDVVDNQGIVKHAEEGVVKTAYEAGVKDGIRELAKMVEELTDGTTQFDR